MIPRIASGIGFVLGLFVGIVAFPFWWAGSVAVGVVEYSAHDYEHGTVVIEERSNRITGTVTRRVYSIDENYLGESDNGALPE